METESSGVSQRLASLVQDAEIAVVNKDAVAALAGEFAGDAGSDESLHGFGGGGKSHVLSVTHVFERQHRALAKGREDAQGVGARRVLTAECGGCPPRRGPPAAGRSARRCGRFDPRLRERSPPTPPSRPGSANAVEEFVIRRAVLLKVKRKIEQRIGEQSTVVEQQCNEQAAQTAVAVEEGMDGLELHMGDGGLENTGRPMVSSCKKSFEIAHAGVDVLGGWRNKKGVAWAGAADPVLAATEFARLTFRCPGLWPSAGVHLAQQAVGERKAFAQSLHAVIQGGDVV